MHLTLSVLALLINLFLTVHVESMFLPARASTKVGYEKTFLFICDMQDKFSPLIYRSATVVNNMALLNNVANVLRIPVIVTEQYPKVFGRTVQVNL